MTQDKKYIDRVYSALSDKVEGFNKTPEEFYEAIKSDDYKSRVYSALSDKVEGFNKTPEEFNSLLATDPQKKNSNSTGSQAPKDSQSKATPKQSTSVGGKQPQVKPSVTSSGKDNKNPFGGENNTYGGLSVLPQSASKGEPKKTQKPIPVMGEDIQLTPKKDGVKTDMSGKQVLSKNQITYEKPLTKEEVINGIQRNRKQEQKKGLEDVVYNSSKDFDEKLKGEGFLNKTENFLRSSWNNIVSYIPGVPSSEEESSQIKVDKTSIDKYFKQAEDFFNKQGKSVSKDVLTEKAKEFKIEEDKRNYIENQDSKFIENIKDLEYTDPNTGKKEKIKDLLSLNDYNKYKTLDKETVKTSNALKVYKSDLDSIYNEINQTKNVINHQIIFGNFEGATKLYNQILSKEELSNDDRSFIKYYEENKEKASKSPLNPNLGSIIEKLNQSLNQQASDYDETLKQYYNTLEKYDKTYNEKIDAYEDFDNSKRSYDGVFYKKGRLSAAETVNGVLKMFQTLAELSTELNSKYPSLNIGMNKYLFKEIFDGYNYYDFNAQIEKERGLVREDVKDVTDLNSFVNYVSDVTATQSGQMILPVLAGSGKVAMPLLRQSAVYFSSGFGRGVGEAENYEERLKRGELEFGEIGRVYSMWEKVLHGSISGTADIIGNLPTAIRFSRNVEKIISKPETRSMFWRGFTKKTIENVKKEGFDFVKEVGSELGEETFAEWIQNSSKIFVLKDPNANLTDGTLDVLKDTGTFTAVMKVFPLFGKGLAKRISNSSESNIIQEKEKELAYWRDKVNNEGLTEETKKFYEDRISSIESQLNSTYEKARKRIAEKPFLLKEVESVNIKIQQKINEGYAIKANEQLTEKEKAVLLNEK